VKLFPKLKRKPAKLKIILLDKFFNYIENTWLQPGIWSPEAWSVFFQIIRTNNDAEGWHNKLNSNPSRTRYLLDILKTKSYLLETYLIDNYLVTYCHPLKISFLNI
jgi:hypothetical protein